MKRQSGLSWAIVLIFAFSFFCLLTNSSQAQLVVTDAIPREDLPFNIDYPSEWFSRKEEAPGMEAYFFSREQIKVQSDQYRAGMSVMISKGLASNAGNWNEFKKMLMADSKANGMEVEGMDLDQVNGYTALAFTAKSERNHICFVYIKKGDDLVGLILESPKEEWESFKPIFMQTIENFSFK
jgi:hypothetical protein